MSVVNDSPEALDRHLAWLYGDAKRCKCGHAYESMGVVDRINMGKGWVRTTTHPYCPEHGTAASKARTERLLKRKSAVGCDSETPKP